MRIAVRRQSPLRRWGIRPVNEKTSGLFRAIASFVDGSGNPISGADWTARLRDRDCLLDELLGEVALDASGKATFMFNVADIKSMDSPGERNPDLYFTLYHKGHEMFRSEVLEDVDFESLDPVSGAASHMTRAFGPYRVKLFR